MPELKIIVLQGPPASGKSTWARKYQEENKKTTVIISRDSERDSRGVYWEESQEDFITACEEFKIREALRRNLTPILDSTNLNQKTLNKWEKIAEEFNVKCEYKMFYIPFKEALKRDANSDRLHHVGKKVLQNFYEKYFREQYEIEMNFKDSRNILEPNPEKPNCIICDLDGTLAIHTGRNPFDYTKIPTDKFDNRLGNILKLFYDNDVKIFFLSGREAKPGCVENTLNWLKENLPNFNIEYGITDSESDGIKTATLLMRENNDYRADEIVKAEIFEINIEKCYNVMCVFDDRDKVVKMWRDRGILCNQVYYGEF